MMAELNWRYIHLTLCVISTLLLPKDDGPSPLVKTGWLDQSSHEQNYTTNEENTVSQIILFLNGAHGSDGF